MEKTKKWLKWAGLASLVLWWVGVGEVQAALSAVLDLDVTVSQGLSVAVNTVASSTQTLPAWSGAANQQLVLGSSVTVKNDSSASTERWQLNTNANSINTSGGVTWAVQSTTITPFAAAEQFALQAVFGSSNTAAGGCPAGSSTDWNGSYAQPLTSSPVTYTAATFSDTSLSNLGTPNPDASTPNPGEMYAGSTRALCWRLITPSSTIAGGTTQNIQIIVTAAAP